MSRKLQILRPLSFTLQSKQPVFLVIVASYKIQGAVNLQLQGAGVALRPHLPELVSCMLESLSSLEDQRLNYVEVWTNGLFPFL